MNKQYRHKKTNIIATWKDKSSAIAYTVNVNNVMYFLPKELVEGSDEWEEIKPLFDFHGFEIGRNEVAYHVCLDEKSSDVSLHNSIIYEANNRNTRILTTFKNYKDATSFQKAYCAVRKSKNLLATSSGDPTNYLKFILKNI
jgi:hypothetical protein